MFQFLYFHLYSILYKINTAFSAAFGLMGRQSELELLEVQVCRLQAASVLYTPNPQRLHHKVGCYTHTKHQRMQAWP